MSDKYRSLTVILDADIREEEATEIGELMKRVKGVSRVKIGPALTSMDYINRQAAKDELIAKFWELLK